MTNQDIKKILEETNAVVTDDHFVYASKMHGHTYVNKDAAFAHPVQIEKIGRAMAEKFVDENIEVVIGPVVGGALLAQWTAWHLTKLCGREVLAVFADKGEKDADGDTFVIKRGYDALIKGKRTLLVEDVLTTGGSVRKVVAIARQHEAIIAGVCALCNRGGVTSTDIGDVPRLESLVSVTLETFEADHCPLCKAGKPVNIKLGKGKDFLASLK